ncbi:hypothetical protein [Bartonella senegalensis]|uniref:hypothetical protein n=1 Tax=Bartonella senegalensis TaxID=1468418 RepID=UPI0005628A35|nr:hypothetical protein [Bartonella senegalensis]
MSRASAFCGTGSALGGGASGGMGAGMSGGGSMTGVGNNINAYQMTGNSFKIVIINLNRAEIHM